MCCPHFWTCRPSRTVRSRQSRLRPLLTYLSFFYRRTVALPVRTTKQRMPALTPAKVGNASHLSSCVSSHFSLSILTHISAIAAAPPDAVAYAALLRNELLGAGIETVPDPHTDDRRHAVLSHDSHSLFRVQVIMHHACYMKLKLLIGHDSLD